MIISIQHIIKPAVIFSRNDWIIPSVLDLDLLDVKNEWWHINVVTVYYATYLRTQQLRTRHKAQLQCLHRCDHVHHLRSEHERQAPATTQEGST